MVISFCDLLEFYKANENLQDLYESIMIISNGDKYDLHELFRVYFALLNEYNSSNNCFAEKIIHKIESYGILINSNSKLAKAIKEFYGE